MERLSHAEIRAMAMQALKKSHHDQVANVADTIQHMAITSGRISEHYHHRYIRAGVEDVLWELFREGILYPGLGDGENNEWPWFHLSVHGQQVVNSGEPQPYDPDGFIKAFNSKNPTADRIIIECVLESVQCFTHGNYRAAMVMLGAASEQAILLLIAKFETAISDPAKRKKFDKDKGTSIYRNFVAMQERLDLMNARKAFPLDLAESLSGELRGIFDILRRSRNEAGHPAIMGPIDPDSLFLNLRVFAIYIERLYRFIEFFATNPADW